MVKVYFLRKEGRRPRGYIADIPSNAPCQYVDPFIIVQIDGSTIPQDILGDNSVRLNIEILEDSYPDETEEYVDENGDVQTRIVYGYFSEHGRSVVEGCPVITISDVLWGE